MVETSRRGYGAAFALGCCVAFLIDLTFLAILSGHLEPPPALRHQWTFLATILGCPAILINLHQVTDGWKLYDLLVYMINGLYYIIVYRSSIRIAQMFDVMSARMGIR